MNEQAWNEANSHYFAGDAQSFYYAQLQAILRGDLDMQINDDHEQAAKVQQKPLKDLFINKPF